jgi:hypothetical protein
VITRSHAHCTELKPRLLPSPPLCPPLTLPLIQCDAEKTKDDLKAQMHGHEETLEELKKTMHEMHAMLFQMHGMAHLSDEEENNVWLMSVLGDVVDMVTTKEIYDRLWLNYDADRNGNLDIHELAELALDAIRRSGTLIDVRVLRHLSRLRACPMHTAHECIFCGVGRCVITTINAF